MKRISLLLSILVICLSTSAQSVNEVVAKFEEANGGKDRLKAVKTLQVESTMKMNIMGQSFDISLNSIKERGKLYRRQMGGIMGMGNSWTMITDTAGYVYLPSMPGFGGMQGSGASLNKMTAEELQKQQFELDCAGAFGMLVNYAAKGYTAELLGTEKINKEDCYKIKLNLTNGASVMYYVHATNYLVQMVEATGEMAANLTGFGSMMKMLGNDRTRNLKVAIYYSAYKDFGGIQYPMKQVISLGPVETVIENTDVRINEPVDEVWYKTR